MTENVNKADLEASALNDIGACLNEIFSGQINPEEAYQAFISTVHMAEDLGVRPEYILSQILNNLPDFAKERVVGRLVEKCNLSDKEVEEIQAPID
jgi:hypothetical protein